MWHYAGIGSRKTPDNLLPLMEKIGLWLAKGPFVLNSGAAAGADQAFEAGCDRAKGKKRIWLPWNGYNDHFAFHNNQFGYIMPSASEYRSWGNMIQATHPAWAYLKPGAQKLHARNFGQVKDSLFTVCYTLDGCEGEESRTRASGGTASAIIISDRLGAPVFNLANPDAPERLLSFVRTFMAKPKVFDGHIKDLSENEVFVFGSNLAGRHGAGAAKQAYNHFGATSGVGFGPSGQSFAIPTKDGRNNADLTDKTQVLSLSTINQYVIEFMRYANSHPEKVFYISAIGCGLAGFSPKDIGPLFNKVRGLSNCVFDSKLAPYLTNTSPVQDMLSWPRAINIFSGAQGLGSKLTNPTSLAFKKELIAHIYPIWFNGHAYKDVEKAYQELKTGEPDQDDALMAELINIKLQTYPELVHEINHHGGLAFIKACSHFTHARTASGQAWEGAGRQSRFIRNLIDAWVLHETGFRAKPLDLKALKFAPLQDDLFGSDDDSNNTHRIRP